MGSAGLKALVVGGGIGGLALGIALREAGIETVLFERSRSSRPAGGGLVLWSNGMAALAELGVADDVAGSGSAIERFELLTARGRPLAAVAVGEISRARGRPTVCVTRADLWQVLSAAFGESGLRLGSECVGFTGNVRGVTAELSDAASADADILIGADGRDSVIRRQLLGDSPHRVGVSSCPP